MKSLTLFLLLTFLGSYHARSQNYIHFPDSNATWTDERSTYGPFQFYYYYYYYKTDGKATINDTLYTLISDEEDNPRAYLREEGKKVFCRMSPQEGEFLLYDFGLSVNDTITLRECLGGYTYDAHVTAIDSLLIGSRYHKRFYLESWDWNPVYFIEGVGSDEGLMYCDLPWVDVWGYLYCFSLNDTIYKTDGTGGTYPDNCWIYLGISEKESVQVMVYPNPASDVIHVNYNKKCSLEMVNILGMMVCKSDARSLDMSNLNNGIYFLNIYSETGSLLKRVKIIKV